MHTLTCNGRDGIAREFSYTRTQDLLSGVWTFRVETIPPLASGEFFELAVSEIEAGTVRVVMSKHHGVREYVAMGIPEALLPVVKLELQMKVESSPKEGHGSVYRTDAATNYWERLKATGGSIYDPERNVYTVV